MAWVTPHTWTVEEATLALLNDIRDSLRASGGPRSTTPPTATDEQEWYYPADTTNGVVWRLKYNSGSASAYKWEFVGGACMTSAIVTDETSASTTYVDLATVGPSVTVPRAGDYEVELGAQFYNTNGNTGAWVAVKKGAAATADADSISNVVAFSPGISCSRKMIITGLAASDVLKLQYRSSSGVGTGHWATRWLAVRPVRVS